MLSKKIVYGEKLVYQRQEDASNDNVSSLRTGPFGMVTIGKLDLLAWAYPSFRTRVSAERHPCQVCL